MTDPRSQSGVPVDVDAADVAIERIIPPEHPPMDDAAGGPAVDSQRTQAETVGTDELSLQGGE